MSMQKYLTTEKTCHQIVNGPSSMDLFNAVIYAYDKAKRFFVSFRLDDGHTVTFRPVGICHEDGSGHSFNIEGYIHHTDLSPVPLGDKPCQLYYNSHNRQGTISYYVHRERLAHCHSYR